MHSLEFHICCIHKDTFSNPYLTICFPLFWDEYTSNHFVQLHIEIYRSIMLALLMILGFVIEYRVRIGVK